ncbi:MAG: acyltransferase domain-containing protein [Spirochaetes bacterium]|nr:acyltransferase domain-containing protein [Spirochaetota bacterium]
MIRKVIDSRFPVIVYNPTGIKCSNYFNEAYKAGTLPVFDSEFLSSDDIISHINELEDKKILFGLRINVSDRSIIDYIGSRFFKYLNAVVFYYDDVADINILKEYKSIRYKIILEALNIIPSEILREIAPEALIVKGNEAGGRISQFSTFVLMQWYVENDEFPVFAHGGVGHFTAAGFFAAGASGVVLDSQLYLTDESPVTPEFKDVLRKIEEKNTIKCGTTLNMRYRFFTKLATQITKDLKQKESELLNEPGADEKLYEFIRQNIKFMNDTAGDVVHSLIYMGQDTSFANNFVRNSTSISQVIAEFMDTISVSLNAAEEYDQMKADSPVAADHGTTYPVMQGPMANISDKAGFAKAINDGGALPFMAMGSLPENLADTMLSETAAITKTWGAGMIGFSGINKMIDKHIEMVKRYKPGFALFAGGTPIQAKELEAEGIKTYLHMPSPAMFENGVNNNCTRFIFEGHEAGGHVGALTSTVLWELSIQKVMTAFPDKAKDLSLIFAGGIGSASGTNFITGMTSQLSKAGAKIGIQVGTAYLYTNDIVEQGNIKKKYQELICDAEETIVTGETIGLTTRTLPTTFTKKMIEREHERVRKGLPLQDRKHEYEVDNFGALLIGAKGFCPEFGPDGKVTLKHFDEDDQMSGGNYMCGEALIFNRCTVTIDDVHDKLFKNKKQLNENLNAIELLTAEDNQLNDEIAIIGLGCVYPDADNVEQYWNNIISKKYSIRQFTKFNFKEFYFDPDHKAEDKAYSGIAGQIDNFKFEFEKFGYTKAEADEISPSQQVLLQSAMQAVESSGYYSGKNAKMFPKSKTSVIMGSCLSNPVTDELILKQYYPEFKYYLNTLDEFKNLSDDEKTKILDNLKKTLRNNRQPKFPTGAALNVEASRISAHLGLEGVNYTVDAACATSFTAVDNAIKELLSGDADVSIAGGVNTNLSPETFVGFCKMGALSDLGSFPFDQRAGGFVLGAGAGVVILKRMKDAISDGDKIFAVIKGAGASTDGKGKAIAAPQQRGQLLAIERCYENCKDENFKPDKIEYIEAHGTSTLMGDKTEMETIRSFYGNFGGKIGVSSVKSQIGHLLGGAGAAGLIKAVMALQNKILPPNANYEIPSSKFDISDSSLYVIADVKEWTKNPGETRKAAVSSYGFGGINYHLGVEEYTENYKPLPRKINLNGISDPDESRIVISGIGVIVPGALNSSEFWNVLQTGEKQFSKIPEERFHNAAFVNEDKEYSLPEVQAGIIKNFNFNNVKFRIPPTAVKSIDRAQILGLEIADEAIKNAGIESILKDNRNRVGVILGTSTGEMHNDNMIRTRTPFLESIVASTQGVDGSKTKAVAVKFAEKLRERYYKNTEDSVPGLLSNIVPGRIANFFNCNGPSYIVEAECASSAVAINASIREIRSGKSDIILCGGIDANLSPSSLMAYNLIKVLSDGDSAFFDKNSKGLVMGEGGAILVLTSYKYAKENNMPVIAEIADMDFQSYPAENMLSPTTAGFGRIMNRFYRKNSISRNKIDYIDVFASSNKVVDKWELDALENSFKRKLYFGNSKSQLSYLRAANPAVVLSKLALMTEKNTVAPNKTFNSATSLVSAEMSLTGTNDSVALGADNENYFAANFAGLGGNIGHVVVKTFPKRLSDEKTVSTGSDISFAKMVQPAVMTSVYNDEIALLFSGQGSQYPGMMKQLYAGIPEIKSVLDQGEAVFKAERGYSLLDLMFGTDAEKLNLTENTQPSIFLSSAAIYTYLKSKGLKSSTMIGHSLGEISALFAAGVMSFDNAMKLVIKRSDLMKQSADEVKGSIMVVFKNASETSGLIKSSGIDSIYLANKNSDSQTAVSGKTEGIDAFCKYLDSVKAGYTRLKLSGAFHSPLFKKASDEFRKYIENIEFNVSGISSVVANFTAGRYPQDVNAAKDMLAKQIISPVEFVESVKSVSSPALKYFLEIGPNNILTKMLAKISGINAAAVCSADPKKDAVEVLITASGLSAAKQSLAVQPSFKPAAATVKPEISINTQDSEYKKFLETNSAEIQKLLYSEFIKQRKEDAFAAVEKRGIYTGTVVIPGVSLGLPGKAGKVFNDDNFAKILKGQNFIDSLSVEEQNKMVDKNITRVFKDPSGNAKFVEINDLDHIVHLAGQLGYFSLKEYGVDFEYDITYGLAIASGIEALKDANIPLVQQYKKMSNGAMMPDGYALPVEYQSNTGIIFTSLFPGFETLIREISAYYREKFSTKPFEEFEKIYFYLMEKVKDTEIKKSVTDWYMRAKDTQVFRKYSFDRALLTQIIALGSGHFAQMIKAKGPNTMVSGACASATQAVAVAEDWIRMGRCDRVIIVGGEAATSEIQNEWITSGFLALGAASVKRSIDEASKPFDEDRNGMIVGSGAFGLIVEREDKAEERGFNGQAEILGTYIGNSAFHVSKIDVEHLSEEMDSFFTRIENMYGKSRSEYARSMAFMSHETYTPARGGSADAEVSAIKTAFPADYKNITITNVKGYTGHTLGAGIEDVVLVKALQAGVTPAIPNLKKIPAHFADLKFSNGSQGNFEYGFHLAAGFGSHFSFLFIKRREENKAAGNGQYASWLQKISGLDNPEMYIQNNALCLKSAARTSDKPAVTAPAAAAAVKSVSPTVTVDINKIKAKIAEQTGYDVSMLDENLDLEADLGIDTVKQVEIFGEISSQFGLEVPEDLQLSTLNTIRKITDYISSKTGSSAVETGLKPVSTTATVSVDINKIKATIAEQTGYDVSMLDENLDLEADLGIDTVKQVEIFGEISSQFGLEVPEDLQLSTLNTIRKITDYISSKTGSSPVETGLKPVSTTAVSVDINKIKATISDQTGYEVSMLDENLDLEADLGIDTVKQVEIFGEISSQFGLEVPEDIQLSTLNTIRKITDYISSKTGSSPVETGSKPVETGLKPVSTVDINKIKATISDQTGYEVSMLDENLDLEADLGIDTVKQVEIFGEISSQFGLEVPEDIQLSTLNTIRKITDYISSKTVSSPVETGSKPVETGLKPVSTTTTVSVDINKIKATISEQTGYEVSMLDENLDLEADLGIDTVKQVEIFGEISSQFGLEVPEDIQLSTLNTIKKISEYLSGRLSGAAQTSAAVTAPAASVTLNNAADSGTGIKRLVMYASERKITFSKKYSFKNKSILVTPDSKGFYEKLKSYIEAEGGKVVSFGKGCDINIDITKTPDETDYTAKIAEAGNIDGLILLNQIDYAAKKESYSDAELNASVKAAFMLIKTCFNKINKADSIVAALSFNSVVFPYGDDCKKITPVFAGISGLLKTAAKELKPANVKIVDFKSASPEKQIDEFIDLFVKEIETAEKQVETGYDSGKRYVVRIKEEAPLAEKPFIKEGSTLLVTGGARGITYEIIRKVAETYRTNIIILGRSDIYSLDKFFLDKNTSAQDIFNRMKEQMSGSKPVEIKKAAEKIISFRESAYNIEELKKTGVTVNYHAVDAADEESVVKIISSYDKIDGVLHAAGLDESQFIVKKDLKSFNRVFDTKIIGLRNIFKAFKERQLDYMMTFSSVTARFGNEGQADYTAANDMLGKMLQSEKQKRKGLVVKTYDWTAWAEVGMATNATVKKVLEDRGLTFLPLKDGIQFFMNDITDSKTEEVLISGIDHDFDPDKMLPQENEIGEVVDNFLDKVDFADSSKTVLSRKLQMNRDLFLNDHAMHEVPIFLGATGIEMMAEAVKFTNKSSKVISRLTEFEIPYGIKILKGRPKDLIIEVERSGDTGRTFIKSLFINPKGEVVGDPKIHYKGLYSLSSDFEKSDTILPDFSESPNAESIADLMYHPERLFMGGVFDSVEKVLSFDGKNLITLISDTSDADFFSGMPSPDFEMDVVLLDGMFQTGGMVEFISTDNMVLPFRIKEMKICGKTEKYKKYFCRTERLAEDQDTVTFNVTLFDENKKVIYDIREFQMVKISKLKDDYRIKDKVKF